MGVFEKGGPPGSAQLLDRHPERLPRLRLVGALQAARDEGTIQRLIDGLPEEVAVVDRDWNIVAINDAWHKASVRANTPSLLKGGNYYHFCESNLGRPGFESRTLLDALEDVSADRRKRFWHSYSDHAAGQIYSYRVCISRVEFGGSVYATITRYEITELVNLRNQCQLLGTSVLDIQDGERRRIGRELHDSTAQLLVALQLDVMRLKQSNADPTAMEVFEDIADTIAKIHVEIRAISYIFHPPMHAEQSITDALQDLISGFGKRTGLKMTTSLRIRSQTLPALCEATIFRIAQEALANVHRHAFASAVQVRVSERNGAIRLVIHDDGIGVPGHFYRRRAPRVTLGVGIAGMEERLAQFGGRLTFRRVGRGTCLVARLPIEATAEAGQVDLVQSLPIQRPS